eukprot:jgi/Mesen1/5646/ME000286S04856
MDYEKRASGEGKPGPFEGDHTVSNHGVVKADPNMQELEQREKEKDDSDRPPVESDSGETSYPPMLISVGESSSILYDDAEAEVAGSPKSKKGYDGHSIEPVEHVEAAAQVQSEESGAEQDLSSTTSEEDISETAGDYPKLSVSDEDWHVNDAYDPDAGHESDQEFRPRVIMPDTDEQGFKEEIEEDAGSEQGGEEEEGSELASEGSVKGQEEELTATMEEGKLPGLKVNIAGGLEGADELPPGQDLSFYPQPLTSKDDREEQQKLELVASTFESVEQSPEKNADNHLKVGDKREGTVEADKCRGAPVQEAYPHLLAPSSPSDLDEREKDFEKRLETAKAEVERGVTERVTTQKQAEFQKEWEARVQEIRADMASGIGETRETEGSGIGRFTFRQQPEHGYGSGFHAEEGERIGEGDGLRRRHLQVAEADRMRLLDKQLEAERKKTREMEYEIAQLVKEREEAEEDKRIAQEKQEALLQRLSALAMAQGNVGLGPGAGRKRQVATRTRGGSGRDAIVTAGQAVRVASVIHMLKSELSEAGAAWAEMQHLLQLRGAALSAVRFAEASQVSQEGPAVRRQESGGAVSRSISMSLSMGGWEGEDGAAHDVRGVTMGGIEIAELVSKPLAWALESLKSQVEEYKGQVAHLEAREAESRAAQAQVGVLESRLLTRTAVELALRVQVQSLTEKLAGEGAGAQVQAQSQGQPEAEPKAEREMAEESGKSDWRKNWQGQDNEQAGVRQNGGPGKLQGLPVASGEGEQTLAQQVSAMQEQVARLESRLLTRQLVESALKIQLSEVQRSARDEVAAWESRLLEPKASESELKGQVASLTASAACSEEAAAGASKEEDGKREAVGGAADATVRSGTDRGVEVREGGSVVDMVSGSGEKGQGEHAVQGQARTARDLAPDTKAEVEGAAGASGAGVNFTRELEKVRGEHEDLKADRLQKEEQLLRLTHDAKQLREEVGALRANLSVQKEEHERRVQAEAGNSAAAKKEWEEVHAGLQAQLLELRSEKQQCEQDLERETDARICAVGELRTAEADRKRQLAEHKKLLEKLQAEVAEAGEQRQQQEELLRAKGEEVAALRGQLAEAEAQGMLPQLQAQLGESEAANAKLAQVLAEVRAESEEGSKEKYALAKEAAQLRGKLDHLSKENAQLAGKSSQLHADLAREKKERQSLESKIGGLRDSLAEKKAELAEQESVWKLLEEERAAVEKLSGEKREMALRLQAEREASREKSHSLVRLEGALRESQAEKKSLVVARGRADESLKALLQEREALDRHISGLEANFGLERDEKEALETHVVELEGTLEQVRTECGALKARVKEEEARAARAEASLSSERREKDGLRKERDELAAGLDSERQKCATLAKELQVLKARQQELEQEREKLQAEVETLKGSVDEHKEEREAAQRGLCEVQDEVKRVQGQLSELQVGEEASKREEQTRAAGLAEEMSILKASLDQARAEFEPVWAESQRRNETIGKLEAELEKARGDLAREAEARARAEEAMEAAHGSLRESAGERDRLLEEKASLVREVQALQQAQKHEVAVERGVQEAQVAALEEEARMLCRKICELKAIVGAVRRSLSEAVEDSAEGAGHDGDDGPDRSCRNGLDGDRAERGQSGGDTDGGDGDGSTMRKGAGQVVGGGEGQGEGEAVGQKAEAMKRALQVARADVDDMLEVAGEVAGQVEKLRRHGHAGMAHAGECARLREEVANLREECVGLRAELAKEKLTTGNLEGQVAEVQSQLSRNQEERKQLTEQVALGQSKLARSLEEGRLLGSQLAEAQVRERQVSSQLASSRELEHERARAWTEEADAMRSQVATLEDATRDAQRDLQALRQELAEKSKQFQEARRAEVDFLLQKVLTAGAPGAATGGAKDTAALSEPAALRRRVLEAAEARESSLGAALQRCEEQTQWARLLASNLTKAENEVELLADELEELTDIILDADESLAPYASIIRHYPGMEDVLVKLRKAADDRRVVGDDEPHM